EAADDFVGRGDHEIGAAFNRARREIWMESEMGAPGLVGDQWYPATVGDLGQAGDVGAGTEVSGGHDYRGGGIRTTVQGLGERGRGQAMRHPQIRVDLGCGEGRL